jgi:hypothetical protein
MIPRICCRSMVGRAITKINLIVRRREGRRLIVFEQNTSTTVYEGYLLTLEPDSSLLCHVVCVDVGLYTTK